MAREILSETIMKQMSTEGNEEEAMATDGDETENAGAEDFENDDDLDNDIEDDENEVASRREARFQGPSLSFVFLFAGRHHLRGRAQRNVDGRGLKCISTVNQNLHI